MKWFSLSLLAALALFGSACERHSAEQTLSALEGEKHAGPSAHSPEAMPQNPAGSGPVNEHPAARHTDGADLHKDGAGLQKDTPKLLPESK